MALCKYCGTNAGLFKSVPKECEAAYNSGISQISQIISDSQVHMPLFYIRDAEIREIARNSFINEEELNSLISSGFDKIGESFLEDGILTVEEETTLIEFQKAYPQEILDRSWTVSIRW
jgi:hypothetical protein